MATGWRARIENEEPGRLDSVLEAEHVFLAEVKLD